MTLRISWEDVEETEGEADLNFTITEHVLEFDAVTKESHESSSEVTQHTVESGEAISDHKRANPRTIQIDAFVTNTPLDAPPPSGPRGGSVTTRTQDNVTVFSQEFDRVSDVWETLLELQRGSFDLTVTTRYQVYENVQLVKVSTPRDTAEDSVMFSLSLQEVFRASSELVDDPVPREPRARRNRETNNAPEESDAPNSEDGENESILSRLFSDNQVA